MTEPATGVTAPAAGGQDGSGQPAGGQPAQTVVQPGGVQAPQPAQPAEQKQVTVPLSVVEAVRRELSDAKASKAEIEAKLTQIQAMQQVGGFQPAQQAQPSQPAQPEDPLGGMEDDELVNAKDIRKILKAVQGNPNDFRQAIEPLRAEVAKIQLQAMDPNYEQTIRTYLPDMITANPMLREMIVRAPNPLVAALGIARISPRYVQAQQAVKPGELPAPPPDILSDLQKIIENATRPGTPGSMGGGGAISGNDRFRNMNDTDFDAEVNRVLTSGAR